MPKGNSLGLLTPPHLAGWCQLNCWVQTGSSAYDVFDYQGGCVTLRYLQYPSMMDVFPDSLMYVCTLYCLRPACTRSLSDALAHEHAKRERWHHENVRRRHNYIPLLFNMLQVNHVKRL